MKKIEFDLQKANDEASQLELRKRGLNNHLQEIIK